MERIDYWLQQDGWTAQFNVNGPPPNMRIYTKANLRVAVVNMPWKGRWLELSSTTIVPQVEPYAPKKYTIPDTEAAWLDLKNGFYWMSGQTVT